MPTPPETIAVCKFTVKKGKERAFGALLGRHFATLSKLGLTATKPHMMYKGTDHRSGRTVFVEIFAWKDLAAPGKAHGMPEVMAVWEPMGAMCESMEFPNVAPFTPPARKR